MQESRHVEQFECGCLPSLYTKEINLSDTWNFAGIEDMATWRLLGADAAL